MDRYNYDYNDETIEATHRVEFVNRFGQSVSMPARFENDFDCINAACADIDMIELHSPGMLIVSKYGELQPDGLYDLKEIYSQAI